MERLSDWFRRHLGWTGAGYVLLVVVVRFKYVRQMASDGLPYLADADCYTRMERVRCLLADGHLFRGFHPWENAPVGITTHATALLDILIAAPALILNPLTPMAVEWIGWALPPLLAGLAAWMIWRLTASPALGLGWTRWPILLTFALHPLTVWANSVGRPDHQALTVPLITLALILDLLRAVDRRPSPLLPWLAGACWGTALWVSLYEPLVLFSLATLLGMMFLRHQWRYWLGGAASVALPLWLLEGWRWSGQALLWRDPHLSNWLAMIGELKPPPPWHWLTCAIVLPAFAIAVWRCFASGKQPAHLRLNGMGRYEALYPWAMTLALVGLSLWQQRWMALLPFPLAWASFSLLRGLKQRSWQLSLTLLHLVPMVSWTLWELPQIRPPKEAAELREVASHIGDSGTVLGPWWLSPALLHFSGRPIVASSSHQSLPGILDSARFFTTPDFTEADAILQRRQVEWIAVYRPERTFANARQLLYGPGADPTIEERNFYRYVILRLWDVKMVPTRYRLVYASTNWRLYQYGADKPGPELPGNQAVIKRTIDVPQACPHRP